MFDVAEPIAEGPLQKGPAVSWLPDPASGSADALVSSADAAYRAIARATRELFGLLVEIGRSGAWEDDGARDLAHWVQMRYGISGWKAHRWIDAAHAIEHLPDTAEALASGALGVDKVVELTRFATPETERGLIAWAASVSSGAIRRRADLETERPREAAADLDRERRLRWWLTDEGRRMELLAELPAADGALVAAAIERTAASLPEMPDEPRDDAIEIRRADALVMLCAGRGARGARGRARIVVHASPSTIVHDRPPGRGELEVDVPAFDGAVLEPPTVERLRCEAELQVVTTSSDGAPLRLGRTTRLPTAALSSAVRRRDRECRFPGCGARRFTEAHHIVWWSRGGSTDLENLVLLCGFHHRLVHEHGWALTRDGREGFCWTKPDGTGYRAGPSPPPAPG
jgi:hypothetical protein